MKMTRKWIWTERRMVSAVVFGLLTLVCLSGMGSKNVFAQEGDGVLYGGADSTLAADGSLAGDDLAEGQDMTEEEEMPGIYTMAEGWCLDEEQSTDEVEVYRQTPAGEELETSTISCSYLATNYSRQDYEQLRDMLTNNLIYDNVDAQITTSAVYTLSMDYLYIILVDDSSEDYCDIYHYVVGDYQCFCVQVREYRAEARQAEAQETDTPREIGKTIAEEFVWNE